MKKVVLLLAIMFGITLVSCETTSTDEATGELDRNEFEKIDKEDVEAPGDKSTYAIDKDDVVPPGGKG